MGLSSLLRGYWRRLAADFLEECPPWKARSGRWAAILVLAGIGLEAIGCLRSEASDGATPAAWPAPIRLGLGYIGGFLLGWTVRRLLKLTLTLGAGALAVLFSMRQLDLVDLGWERDHSAGLDWVRAQTRSTEDLLKSRLPSAAAASLGGWMGFFYRARRVPEEEPDENEA